MLIVNKRGVAKTAAQDSENFGRPANWLSKYGSVTLNQYGREFPEGGMNEAGLVVQSLSLLETEYPDPDQRPAITSSQWIQYQLDNFNTVEDVISNTAKVRIGPSPHYPGAHYFVCDRFAACASIEFIMGKLVSHSQQTMPVKALTNSPYALSMVYWIMNHVPVPDRSASVKRFLRTANLVTDYGYTATEPAERHAFSILRSVENMGGVTQWSIVYGIRKRRITFRTLANKRIRYLNLDTLDYSCGTPVKVLNINAKLAGNLSNHLRDYTQELNRKHLVKALNATFGKTVPSAELEAASKEISQYPDTMICGN